MQQRRNIWKILIPAAAILLTAICVLASLFRTNYMNAGSCENCGTSLPLPESTSGIPVPQPTSGIIMPPTGGEVNGPLSEIDHLLQQSMSGSLAYNAPDEMNIDDTVTIELLLSPNLSEEELKKQITATGTVVSSADVKLTGQMEAEIVSADPEAFTIRALQRPRQLISNVEPTEWTWYVTARKSGKQKLTVVVYRVIEYQGEQIPRTVKEYESDIDVKVTPQSWLVPFGAVLLLILLVAGSLTAWLISRRRQQKPTRAGAGRRGRKTGGNIFISYRRSDSADITGRIYDSLVDNFGREPIFKDVDSIPLGVDFKKYLDQKVSECKVLLAIVGDEWADARDAQGNRRLDDPEDFVRIEIESALERGIPVIPLLVRGAQLPAEENLPSSLRQLVYQNGMPVRPDPDFHHDMDRLVSALDQYV